MHDYDDDYLYATIADLDAAVRYSVRLIREQYAGHVPERCLQCGRRDHPDACALPQRTRVQDNPDCVSPAVAKASRALAASEKLLSENNDPRMVDGFCIVFGPGYEHSR